MATYSAKYPKAVECLEKDRDELLAFYDFPAKHWQHIRTTNPVESTFVTVHLRTAKNKGLRFKNHVNSQQNTPIWVGLKKGFYLNPINM